METINIIWEIFTGIALAGGAVYAFEQILSLSGKGKWRLVFESFKIMDESFAAFIKGMAVIENRTDELNERLKVLEAEKMDRLDRQSSQSGT